MKGEAVGFKGYALAIVVSVLMVSMTAFAGEWRQYDENCIGEIRSGESHEVVFLFPKSI